MPLDSARAFSLGTSPFNEQDKLVHLLTEDKGIIKGVAPGSLKGKNRFGPIFELFTEGNFFFYRKEDRDFVTFSKGDIIKSYFETVSNPSNVFYFYFISEIITKFVPSDFRTRRVYNLVKTILENSEKGKEPGILVLYFMIWILRIEGMMFNPGLCYNCFERGIGKAWIKEDYRGILCAKCRSGEKTALHSDELNFIKWTEKNSADSLDVWIKKIPVKKLFFLFKKKIEHHGEISLKSSRYLKELS
ncbi:MAG: DNA repair protein RecO [Acidobacteriota bacterium]